jgi:hypothetical protein
MLGTCVGRAAFATRTKGPAVRAKITKLKTSVFIEMASQCAMGIAMGVAFALIVTCYPVFGMSRLLAVCPLDILMTFVGFCALTFGVGAGLTGFLFWITEDNRAA